MESSLGVLILANSSLIFTSGGDVAVALIASDLSGELMELTLADGLGQLKT